jgi:endonuclease III
MNDTERVINILDKRYPQKGDMDLGNPKDTLLGVLLSARTRDSQVLKIYPAFRKRFPTFASLAKSSPKEIATYISTIGLYQSKAKAIYGLAKIIQEKHRGKVPSTMESLCELPGVGRKTANCVLAYVFGEDTVCVDTHVFRIAHRLGWSKGKTPEAVERDIQKLLPKRLWKIVNRTFVRFGREICIPGNPKCEICPVRQWCEYGRKIKS